MADMDSVIYNIAAFMCALLVLESGADRFIDHTAIFAKRTGIPEGLIALLTAGAEWEELAVVVFSIARGRNSLALGNVVGSAISNILGAFSLGLLFSSTVGDGVSFDASSKRYTVLQLGITILAAISLGLREYLNLLAAGTGLIIIFVLYIGSVFWAIRKGLVTGPELSESDNDTESASDSSEEINHRNTSAETTSAYGTFDDQNRHLIHGPQSSAEAQLLADDSTALFSNSRHHSSKYHLFHLTVGFLMLLISAYVLTHAATTLIDQLGLSDEAFGIVVLSIATTLPDKLVATLSGLRGQTGTMIANTVGSNIFLLTLCLGIVWVSPSDGGSHAAIGVTELAILVASSAAMCIVVFTRDSIAKALGIGFLVAYFAFLSLEITVMRHGR